MGLTVEALLGRAEPSCGVRGRDKMATLLSLELKSFLYDIHVISSCGCYPGD